MWKANLPDPSLNINIFLEEGKELALHLLILHTREYIRI